MRGARLARRSRRRAENPDNEPLHAFLDSLASGAPTPGGGAAAALAGATAAGLVAMVARVAVARGARGAVRGARGVLGSARDDLRAAAVTAALAARSDRLRRRLTLLIARDAAAFGAVLAARRTAPSRSHASGARGAVRGALGSARAQRALRVATEVPLEVARKSADVLALAAGLAPRARPSTLADLGTAAALAGAALEAGALTARANLEDLEDRTFVTRSARELERLSAAGARAGRRVASALVGRRRRGPAAKRRGGPAAA